MPVIISKATRRPFSCLPRYIDSLPWCPYLVVLAFISRLSRLTGVKRWDRRKDQSLLGPATCRCSLQAAQRSGNGQIRRRSHALQ